MLILPIKKSTYQKDWYEKNKERLSAKRKKRYAENSAYRQRLVETSRRRRSGEQPPPTPPVPADAPISFEEAADRLGKGLSTLREWRRRQFLPEPTRHNRGLWFSEKQVTLLGKLKEYLEEYGNCRRPQMKLAQLKEVRAFIASN